MVRCSTILMVFLVFFVAPYAQGQVLEVLTKEAALAQMLEHNFGIKISQNTAEQARNNAQIFNSGYLPTVSANSSAGYRREDQEVTFRDGAVTEVSGAETKNLSTSINLNYTLFDGLGRMYNYKRLKESYELTQFQVRETIELTVLQLFSVYYEVARLTENQAILQQTLDNTKDRLLRVSYGFDFGQRTKLDVLTAEVDMVNDSIALMNGKQLLRNTKRDLAVILNTDVARDFEIETDLTFIAALLLEESEVLAATQNVRIQQAEKNKEIGVLTAKFQKSILLPRLGLTGSYGWNEGLFPATGFATKSITSGASAGLQLSWNLFDGGMSRTALRNSKISVENQDLALAQIRAEVQKDLDNAKDMVSIKRQIHGLLQSSVVTAQNNYERSLERFGLGQMTSIELRQAQVNLLNAQISANGAKYQAKLAELEFLQQTGQLLNVTF